MTYRTASSPEPWRNYIPAAIAFILVSVLLYKAADILLMAFAGVLLAVFLRGLSMSLARQSKLGEGLSLAFVILALLGIAILMISYVAPQVAEQVDQLAQKLPEAARQGAAFLEQYGWGRSIRERLSDSGDLVSGATLARVGGFFTTTLGTFVNLILVLFVGIYVAATPDIYRRGIIALFPVSRRRRVGEILDAEVRTLQNWLIGKTISMAFIGISVWIGLAIIGVPLALTFALIAGSLSFVPNLGPVLALFPPLLLALAIRPSMALYVLIYYLALQAVETYVITPMIERRAVSLPPALIIVAQILMGVLFGFWGLLLATPLTAAIVVLVKMVYIEDWLGDPAAAAGHELPGAA